MAPHRGRSPRRRHADRPHGPGRDARAGGDRVGAGDRHDLRRCAPHSLRRDAEPGVRSRGSLAGARAGRMDRRRRARARSPALREGHLRLVRSRCMTGARFVRADGTRVFVRELDRAYPLIERAEGVWLYDGNGTAYLDAVGGGAMVASLGQGVAEIVEAAREQALRVSFLYNQQFTTPPQEKLAAELIELAPPGFARVHFCSGGAEANETAVRLARSYHVERGEPSRWRIVSPAQAYHGPTAVTLALTGRPGLQRPYEPYL